MDREDAIDVDGSSDIECTGTSKPKPKLLSKPPKLASIFAAKPAPRKPAGRKVVKQRDTEPIVIDSSDGENNPVAEPSRAPAASSSRALVASSSSSSLARVSSDDGWAQLNDDGRHAEQVAAWALILRTSKIRPSIPFSHGSTAIGTSGYCYSFFTERYGERWSRKNGGLDAEALYPLDIVAGKYLEYYAKHFSRAVELDASYYNWPRLATFLNYASRTAPDFRFAIKSPGALTHDGELKPDAQAFWLPRIINGLRALGSRMGTFLLQLGPGLVRNDANLDATLAALSEFRVAVEFRHDSWFCEPVLAILRKHNAAFCVAHGSIRAYDTEAGPVAIWARMETHVTATHVYVRLHGTSLTKPFAGEYTPAELDVWVDRIKAWRAAGLHVEICTNNTEPGAAVRTARYVRLAALGWLIVQLMRKLR